MDIIASRVRLLAVLVAGVGLLVVAMTQSAELRPPDRLVWLRPDGQTSSCADTTKFRTLQHDGAVWTLCRTGDLTSLARFDLERGVAEVRWPFPSQLALRDVIAFARGPDRELAVIYAVEDGVAFAIAGRDGWLHAPTRLPSTRRTDVLGAGWNAARLEVMLSDGDDSSRFGTGAQSTIDIVATDGTRTPFLKAPRACPTSKTEPTTCLIARAYVGYHRWYVEGWDDDLRSFVLDRDGSMSDRYRGERREELGGVVPFDRIYARRHWMTTSDGIEDADHARPDPRTLDNEEGVLVVSDTRAMRTRVAVADAACTMPKLLDGVLAFRDAGGYWLVTADGCYVAIP